MPQGAAAAAAAAAADPSSVCPRVLLLPLLLTPFPCVSMQGVCTHREGFPPSRHPYLSQKIEVFCNKYRFLMVEV